MTNEPTIDNEQDLTKRLELGERPVEQQAEVTEADLATGVQILETPADGSFLHGLQAFVAWVKGLVVKDD